jgi:NADH-quinone oxidoreductase subunit H
VKDLFDLYLTVVNWFLDAAITVLEHLGLGGGYLHRLISWLSTEAAEYIAAGLAAVVLLLWTSLLVGIVTWTDRRVRARAEGRAGPRTAGPFGILQFLADWLKMLLKERSGMPSAVAAGTSGAMVLAALALMPMGPWAKLADPEWGLVVVTALLAMAPLPMAVMAPLGRRHAELAETVGTGVVLMLAAGSMMLIGASARSGDLVDLQASSGWGLLLSPVGFLLLLAVMVWESDRLARLRTTGTARETWPGPHRALGTYSVAARYLALSLLATLLFLGGWHGPLEDTALWTMLKTLVLLALTSMVAGALPVGRPSDRASAVRTRWFPLATLNLVVVAAILEVMS